MTFFIVWQPFCFLLSDFLFNEILVPLAGELSWELKIFAILLWCDWCRNLKVSAKISVCSSIAAALDDGSLGQSREVRMVLDAILLQCQMMD